MSPFPKKKDKAAQKLGFTKKCKPTGPDSVEPDLFAIPWAERTAGVEGWALTEICPWIPAPQPEPPASAMVGSLKTRVQDELWHFLHNVAVSLRNDE